METVRNSFPLDQPPSDNKAPQKETVEYNVDQFFKNGNIVPSCDILAFCMPCIVFYSCILFYSSYSILFCFMNIIVCIFLYAFCSMHVVLFKCIQNYTSNPLHLVPSISLYAILSCILFCTSRYTHFVLCNSTSTSYSLYFIQFISLLSYYTMYSVISQLILFNRVLSISYSLYKWQSVTT